MAESTHALVRRQRKRASPFRALSGRNATRRAGPLLRAFASARLLTWARPEPARGVCSHHLRLNYGSDDWLLARPYYRRKPLTPLTGNARAH
eukprot:7105528-Prymnesium_polylepis.1